MKEKKQEKKEGKKKRKSRKRTFRAFVDGTFLANKVVLEQLPFILFLTVLTLIYIGNRYHAEKIVRETNRLKREINALRAEAISTSAELMYKSTKSQVLRAIREKNLGLEESRVPPKKIVIGEKEK
jgi:hypothetical protein